MTIKEIKSQNYEIFDSDINYNKLNRIFKDKNIIDNIKREKFYKSMYQIKYEQRLKIINEYSDILDNDPEKKKNPKIKLYQTEKLKNIFIKILKFFVFSNIYELKEKMETEFYVPTQEFIIPFIEGEEETIFANLINDFYDTFIINHFRPDNNKNHSFNEKYLSNIVNSSLKDPVNRKQKIYNSPIPENDNEINSIPKSTTLNNKKFIQKKITINPIIQKYYSNEFMKKREEFIENYQEFKNNKIMLYLYEIYLEVLFYYINEFNESDKRNLIKDFSEIFYENEASKIYALKLIEHYISIKDLTNGENINIEKGLKNIDYQIIILNKYTFTINFYDYNINKFANELIDILISIDESKTEKEIKNKLDDIRLWTLQKHAKINNPYSQIDLKRAFENDIKKMISHPLLERVFNEMNYFGNLQFPYKRNEFIDQISKNIIYIPLHTKYIIGLTIKKMGIIVINKGRFSDFIEEQKNKNKRFILKASEMSFYKISLLHEINFHYVLLIAYYNKKIETVFTPRNIFKNLYFENKMDCGEQGESLIFGGIVDTLYIKGLIQIMTLEYWDDFIKIKENQDIKKLGEIFYILNQKCEETIILYDIKELNEFTRELYKYIDDNFEGEENFINSLFLSNVFSKGKIMNNLENEEEEEIFVFRK